MIIAAHVVSGGAIGEVVDSPMVAFVVGFFFHFVLDLIPHYDNTDKGKWTKRQIIFTSADIILTLFVLFGVLGLKLTPSFFISPFFFGATGGILPDILDNVPHIKEKFRQTSFGKVFHRFHDGLHRRELPPVLGIITQLFVIALFSGLYLATR